MKDVKILRGRPTFKRININQIIKIDDMVFKKNARIAKISNLKLY